MLGALHVPQHDNVLTGWEDYVCPYCRNCLLDSFRADMGEKKRRYLCHVCHERSLLRHMLCHSCAKSSNRCVECGRFVASHYI